jgi:uncharacterized protein YndB with AHSA1/START domain
MEAAIDGETRLEIRRFYQAPVSAVYAAWTDPDQVKQWMGLGDGGGGTEATMDIREGGRYRIVMRSADGDEHRLSGTYREVVPNRRLVCTWAWDSTPERESVVTVEFRPCEQGTELLLTHRRFADAEARDKHHHGWNACLGRLGRFVSQ